MLTKGFPGTRYHTFQHTSVSVIICFCHSIRDTGGQFPADDGRLACGHSNINTQSVTDVAPTAVASRLNNINQNVLIKNEKTTICLSFFSDVNFMKCVIGCIYLSWCLSTAIWWCVNEYTIGKLDLRLCLIIISSWTHPRFCSMLIYLIIFLGLTK